MLKKILLTLSFALIQQQSMANNKDCYYETAIIGQQLLHTVTVNPNKHKIINATAKSTGKNVDHVAHIAHKYHALLAVNGGFFREIDQNLFVPAGILKVANVWHGIAYQPRAAIGWQANSNLVLIDRLKTKTFVNIDNHKLSVSSFNPPYKINNYSEHINYKSVLYSSIYPNFMKLNTKYPNVLIKENDEFSYIYRVNDHIKTLKFSLTDFNLATISVDIMPQLEPEASKLWQTVDFITSGAPVLIKNHNIISNHSPEKVSNNFINGKHARTAICILDNGFWKFVSTSSMSIPELANAMQTFNCKDAINLDGGGSSDLYVSATLSGKQELTSIVNPVTDAILVLPET